MAATWDPSIAEAWQRYTNLFMMFGYARGGYLKAKTIPLS
jgi:hypothetical protein